MLGYNNKNIVLHELIGLKVRVIECKDHSQKGLAGVVLDETKNMLKIMTKNGEKTVSKKISRFKFISARNIFIVDGSEIAFRPSERIEKAFKYYQRRQL